MLTPPILPETVAPSAQASPSCGAPTCSARTIPPSRTTAALEPFPFQRDTDDHRNPLDLTSQIVHGFFALSEEFRALQQPTRWKTGDHALGEDGQIHPHPTRLPET